MKKLIKYPIIEKIHRMSSIFFKPIIISTLNNIEIVKIDKPRDDDNNPIIICDGCNTIIETDFVNALCFDKDFVHSIQCVECVKEYFSEIPIYRGKVRIIE
ncbi:hypothetical protein LCGC14_0540260 [marine sediment metagenome]|uniref:Uncharacterized protein n=1 Tax=marine sediment metagenome TaxID=412755 RepID=A0A0F9RXR0_9ZZZZ